MKTIEIKLESIQVMQNGTLASMDGNNIITATLVFPRAGVQSIISARSVELKNKAVYDYTQESLSEQILFKENVDSKAVLKVEISSVVKVSEIGKLMFKILRTAGTQVPNVIPGIGTIIQAVAGSAINWLFDSLEPQDQTTVIGHGESYIDDLLKMNGADGKAIMDLAVPKEITLKHSKYDVQGNIIFQTLVLHKGYLNARVIFAVTEVADGSVSNAPVA